ncbi:hypothetical protein AAVH_28966 [Aphelenchoides avenae]|nr:hypothetical protein AAVH_28966 [Aphelenchus avenae]
MTTDKVHLLEEADGKAKKWTTFIGPYRDYDWSKWVLAATIYQLTVCALCYTAYVSSKTRNFDVIPMYGVVQLAILYALLKVFEAFDKIKLMGVLMAILGLLQIVFIGFVTNVGRETIRSAWRDYNLACGQAPDSDDCTFQVFWLSFVCIIFVGWELYGTFYVFGVYEAIKQELKKNMKPAGESCDV